MSVVLQMIPPALTLLAVFAALRGQRVTNANAAREKLEAARNEARMVILQPVHPDSQGQPRMVGDDRLILSVDVAGPAPIVQVESVLVTQRSPSVERLHAETMKSEPVLKPETMHRLLLLESTPEAGVRWRLTWEDRYGYMWRSRYSFETGPGRVELLRSPADRDLITTPTRLQKIRNALLPYDEWAPGRRPLR